MKQTTNFARVIGEIQTIARKINSDWFNDELDLDRVVFSCTSTPKAYGHFTPYLSYRVHDKDGERGAVEINIGAGTLDREIFEVVATMIHELCHYYNWCNNVKDTSNNGVYHNKRFKNEAEKHGILIEQAPIIGWSVTTASDELLNWCIENGLESFRLGRNEWSGLSFGGFGKGTSTTTTTTTTKGNSHKLECPCCHTKIRYTTSKAPNIMCMDCNEQMIEA